MDHFFDGNRSSGFGVRTRLNGFTLIELLVVIAIIAILAAILFPVFAQAREKARQTACISNNKQIALAILQYVEDFDESYPAAQIGLTGMGSLTTSYDWTVEINPYVKNGSNAVLTDSTVGKTETTYAGGVYSCPDAVIPLQSNQFVVRADVFPIWYNDGTTPLSKNASGPSVTLSQIDEPSNRIAMYEAGSSGSTTNVQGLYYPMDVWAWYSGGSYQSGTFEPSVTGNGDCDYTNPADDTGFEGCNCLPRYRHTGSCDMQYLDGHVKPIHKGYDFYASDWFIPNLCESYWESCSATP